jgi:ATP-binding cassette subfamily B protein
LNDALRKARLFSRLRAQASALAVLVYGTAMALALWLAWASTEDPGDRAALLVLTSICLASSMRPLELAAQAFRDLALAASLIAPFGVLRAGAEATAPPLMNVVGAEVCLDDVSMEYDNGRRVLRHAHLHCAPGEIIGIVGRSGAGKSTLIRLLTGELNATRGAVRIDGASPLEVTPVSAALQETLLLSDTIYANIAFGRDVTSEEIARAADIAGLDRLLAALPNGLNTRIGEKGANLSGGERQRISLARAMLKPACLYLFDEATSALDADAEQAVMRSVVAHLGGATLIVVAHRMSALQSADRLVELRDGDFIELEPASPAIVRTAPSSRGKDLRSPATKSETNPGCACTSKGGGQAAK